MVGKDRPTDWLPANQDDIGRAQALIERSPDELGPVVPRLIPWLRNDSWPVVAPVADALCRVGSIAIPAVAGVLRGKDPVLKRNVLRLVVSTWPRDDVRQVHTSLGLLVSDSQSWGADLEALQILLRHSLIDRDAASQWIAFKKARYAEFALKLSELERMVTGGS
jgi:hypothetical protein